MTQAMTALARHGRSFRLAGRLLPAETLSDAAELYAFCRAVDDLADQAADPEGARRELLAVRAAIEAKSPAHPLALRLLILNRRRGVSLSAAVGLIDTVLRDIGPVRLADEAALLRYARGAAGTVGLMMCAILRVTDPRAAPHATSLGMAMQLTNIARDVVEDAQRDRIYLPSAWLPRDATPAFIISNPEVVFCAVRRLLFLADSHYRGAERGYGHLPARVRPAIRAAGRIYEEIGRGILRRGPDYLRTGRYVVPATRRLQLLARALIIGQPEVSDLALPSLPGSGASTARV